MNMFVSVGTTMMLVCGIALAAGVLDSRSKDQKAYDEGLALCKRSGCSECGTFGKNGLGGVMYTPSVCEEEFLSRERPIKAKELDAEIRSKFKKDGG